MNSISHRFKSSLEDYPYVVAAILGVAFMLMIIDFQPYVYLGLVVILVALVQVFPLSSRFTEVLIFASLPMIGAIANTESRCLTYNSIVLFLLCRSYACYGKLQIRHIFLYFLVIATWLIEYEEANAVIYGGGIMHGFMHPLSFILLSSKKKWIRLGVFVIPALWAINNIILYKQFFVAFWDIEIFSVYFFWWIGKNKELVVKRIFMISLPMNTFAQMYWDVCPEKGKLVFLMKEFIETQIVPLLN